VPISLERKEGPNLSNYWKNDYYQSKTMDLVT
jgi:hypothetical protein